MIRWNHSTTGDSDAIQLHTLSVIEAGNMFGFQFALMGLSLDMVLLRTTYICALMSGTLDDHRTKAHKATKRCVLALLNSFHQYGLRTDYIVSYSTLGGSARWSHGWIPQDNTAQAPGTGMRP
jgi:hypothetical protein